MEGKDAIFDEGRNGQIVEQICECLPHVRISVFSNALVVKTIHLGDLTTFMVPSQDCHSLRPSDLQRYEESRRF